MSNYPPGVSGHEWQIAGADSEWDETREVECDECDFNGDVEGTVTQWGSWSREFWFECPKCHHEHTREDPEDEDEGPDPDRDRD